MSYLLCFYLNLINRLVESGLLCSLRILAGRKTTSFWLQQPLKARCNKLGRVLFADQILWLSKRQIYLRGVEHELSSKILEIIGSPPGS